MAKLTGISGHFRVSAQADGKLLGSFVQLPFSPGKAAIERQMAENFIASINALMIRDGGERFMLKNPRATAENDFDFQLDPPSGTAALELMEIAPLTGPYAAAPASYRPYELARSILTAVHAKSRHYASTRGPDIYLLLYLTHWTFTLSLSTVRCLQYWLQRERTVFSAIFAYQPLDAHSGVPHWLFPIPPEILGTFTPDDVARNSVINVDPSR